MDTADRAPPATLATVLLAASVTDSLATLATHIIHDLGLGGIALLCATTGVIGIPGTEPVMLFAGFNVYQHHLTMVGIVAFGALGDVVGASIAYAIGYYGRIELIERHGNKLHISTRRLEIARGWFHRYGAPVIFVSRFIPGLRAVFPYAAGVSQMPYSRFLPFAAAGSVLWILGLGELGLAVGSKWQTWRHDLDYVDYVALVLLVALIAFVIVRRFRGRGAPPPADALAE
jgi:membrane protein DedA with SNARE-associated domain